MSSLIFQLLANLFKRKSLQLSILMVFIAIGVFSTLSYQNFLYLQAQNISQLSVFNEIIKPLSGLVLLAQLFLMSMTASQLTPYYCSRGQQGLLLHSTLSNSGVIWVNFLLVIIVSLIALGYFFLVCFCYFLLSEIDGWLIVSTTAGLLLGSLLFGLLILSVSLHLKKSLTALVLTMSVVIVVFGLDEYLRNHLSSHLSSESWSIYLDVLIHLRDGLIIPGEIIRSILWGLLFYSVLLLMVQRLRLSNTNKGLTLLIISLLALFSHFLLQTPLFQSRFFSSLENNKTWDISRAKLNSLDDQFANQIAKIDAPILITAVIDDEKNHDEIRQAFEVIHQYQPNANLTFSNRQSLANQSSLNDQFVTVQIANQQQSIRYPFELSAKESLSQMIIQLTTRSNQWITFVEGHGEPSPFGQSSRDISSFFQSLKQLGWPVAMQNLSKQPVISNNTQVLVIADSQKEWLPSELNALMDYFNRGGNLLVLREAQDRLPEELQALLAISAVSGNLIDWQGYQSGTPHPAILIVNQFDSHPINSGINSLLAFPWSVGLQIVKQQQKDHNEYRAIIQTHSGVWNEFKPEEIELAFNPESGEQRQVFDLAYSVKNKLNGQRIIVVGDSSFLSDAAINNYANQQFSLNLISWLSSQNFEELKTNNQDNFILVNPWTHFLLQWLFALGLPLLLLFFMSLRGLKNRRKQNNSELLNTKNESSHE
jgi:hypothetical protein